MSFNSIDLRRAMHASLLTMQTENKARLDIDLAIQISMLTVQVEDDARLARKLAGQTSSSTTRSLEENLKLHDFQSKECGGDGECFPLSFVHILRTVYGNNHVTAEAVRRITSEYLMENKSTKMEFWIETPAEYDQYVRRIGQKGVWYDHMAVAAAAEAFDVTIRLFYVRSGEIRDINTTSERPIIPLVYTENVHFQAAVSR